MALEAKLALEWLRASGERTEMRLADLVNHFCLVNGIGDHDTCAAILAQAKDDLRMRG